MWQLMAIPDMKKHAQKKRGRIRQVVPPKSWEKGTHEDPEAIMTCTPLPGRTCMCAHPIGKALLPKHVCGA